MDFNSNLIFGVGLGITTGVCIGWLLKGKLTRLSTVQNSVRQNAVGSSNNGTAYHQTYGDFAGEYKLVLIVRSDLKMGKGKIAAQCCHASVLAYRQALNRDPNSLKKWESSGQRKVVLKTNDEHSLLKLNKEADKNGLITSMICDAGRTQIAAGSRTVLGVGPGPEQLIDEVTGHLKLC